MTRRWAALAAVVIAACSDDRSPAALDPTPIAGLDAQVPPIGRDAGVHAISDASFHVLPPPGVVLREDFDHRGHVESSSVAIVDVNHGVVHLPTREFPPLEGDGLRTLSDVTSYNGLIAAGSIVVLDPASVGASDSIELRATDRVHVSGHIRAGAGGVRIVAGRAIYIDGVIESSGPIELMLADETGIIEVTGRITTFAEESRGSSSISIYARGRVRIGGQLEAGAARYGDGGEVTVLAYGDVTLEGPGARLVGGNSVGGTGGWVRVRTEGSIELASGVRLSGGDGELASGVRASRAGGVEVLGASIRSAEEVHVLGGAASDGAGGRVIMKSASVLDLARGTELGGGSGLTGGTVSLEAQTATLTANARGGDGRDEAGRVLVTVAGPLRLGEGSALTAGDGLCSAGGDVVLLAAGPISVAGSSVELTGGRGGASAGNGCLTDHPGGSVRVVAHAVDGPLEASSRGGDGAPPGVLSQSLDPTFSRSAPDIRSRIAGTVTSIPLPRDPLVIGRAPVLVDLRATVPAGTLVRLELADGDRDTPEWYVLTPNEPVEALRDAPLLRYRLHLEGRALDGPEVDGFVVHLGR